MHQLNHMVQCRVVAAVSYESSSEKEDTGADQVKPNQADNANERLKTSWIQLLPSGHYRSSSWEAKVKVGQPDQEEALPKIIPISSYHSLPSLNSTSLTFSGGAQSCCPSRPPL